MYHESAAIAGSWFFYGVGNGETNYFLATLNFQLLYLKQILTALKLVKQTGTRLKRWQAGDGTPTLHKQEQQQPNYFFSCFHRIQAV